MMDLDISASAEPADTQDALCAALALSKGDKAFTDALEAAMEGKFSIAEDGSITLSCGDVSFVATAEQLMPGAEEEAGEGPDGEALGE